MPGMFDPYHRWLGIRPKDQPANHYRLLGIDLLESDREAIRDAADQRMAHVRTYQLGQYSDLSQRILNELAAAKACLLDPQRKAAYDEQLSKAPAPSGKPEAAKKVAGSPPALPQIRPLTEQPTPRPMPRWLLPAAVGGGIALLVAGMGVAFVLMRNPDGPPVARETGTRESTEQDNITPPSNSPVVSPTTGKVKPKTTVPSKPVVGKRPAASLPRTSPQASPKKPEPPKQPDEDQEPPNENLESPHGEKDRSGTASNNRVPISDREVRASLPITLPSPSRAAVTASMLSVPKKWQDTLFPKTAYVFPSRYRNGNLQGAFTLHGVKLHGVAATLHPNGHLETLVTGYSEGLRNGCLKLWDESGKQILYAEYQNDKKHGVLCYFQDGIPWLIQECDKGQPQNEYLVKWMGNGPRVLSTAQLAGDDAAEVSRASQQLATLERKMSNNERLLERKVANWVTGIKNQEKRDRMLGRIHGRNAAKANETNEFWRKALKGS